MKGHLKSEHGIEVAPGELATSHFCHKGRKISMVRTFDDFGRRRVGEGVQDKLLVSVDLRDVGYECIRGKVEAIKQMEDLRRNVEELEAKLQF